MAAKSLTDKKIIVTGGAGFLGRHIVAELERQGLKNVLVPRSRDYNLLDQGSIRRLLADHRPTHIIHAAGTVGGIEANRQNPARFFYENLMIGVQLMHEASTAGVEKFLTVGTICSYPKNTPVPFKEEDLWNGYPEETNAPYGLAKKMLLVQAQTYRQQYGFNSIYIMPVNMYGPYDNFSLDSSHVIPAVIRKCIEAKRRQEPEIVCWGDGSPTREFLFAEDAAQGIYLALLKYDGGDPINLGTGVEISIKDVVNEIAALTGYTGKIRWDSTKPNGQMRRCVDTTKAQVSFGFKASTPLCEGLKKTVDWYLANAGKALEKI